MGQWKWALQQDSSCLLSWIHNFLREALIPLCFLSSPPCSQAEMDMLGLVIVLVQFPPWPCPPSNLIFKGLRGGKAQPQEEICSLVSVGPANLIELLTELPQNPH